ncbi:cupin domain-containing protein [Actinomadura opuntiae]|uniref:cupin domain-containing protein n=1 Tax=Actinomadura sp. OS1-43 TaxID=604315 RepID=UPI00255AEB6E|nr:cupin domain-containing protein [Actinomadura sp. OS1-43]MDL4818411.1 cupin domain-containing protein [Actinomadura sp. OS1-43]
MDITRRPTRAAAPSQWITGDAWIEPVAEPEAGARIDSVRFAPGGRTVWHRHPLGQVLVVTEGTGRVQRRGGPVETIRAGDTVRIAPGEWHWHGAAPTAPMTHLAIEPVSADGAASEPGAPVTDDEYRRDDEDVPPITRSVVLDQHLPAPRSTQRVEVRRITIAPGHAAGLHVHNGPVFGSIETGSAIYQIDGEPASVLGPGDVFYEPENTRIARFDAQDDGVTFLGYFPLAPGESPELTVPDH